MQEAGGSSQLLALSGVGFSFNERDARILFGGIIWGLVSATLTASPQGSQLFAFFRRNTDVVRGEEGGSLVSLNVWGRVLKLVLSNKRVLCAWV